MLEIEPWKQFIGVRRDGTMGWAIFRDVLLLLFLTAWIWTGLKKKR